MKTLFALTKNTFKEAIRDRVLFVIVFFAVIFLLSSLLAGEISARQDDRVIADFGLAMINMFGVFMTIFIGTTLLHKEVEKKTIFTLLSKPIPRSTFILSKFFGLGAVLFLATILMSGIFFFLAPLTLPFVYAILMMMLSFLLLLSVVLFFSSFMSPMLASFSAIIVYVLGYISDDVKVFAGGENATPFMKKFADIVYYSWPNFEILNLKNTVLYDFAFTMSDAFYAVGMTLAFIFILLSLGILIFSHKEF